MYIQNTQNKIIKNSKDTLHELKDKIINWVDHAIMNLPNFLLAIIVFVLFIVLSNLFSKLLDKILVRTKAQLSIRIIVSKVIKYIIILIGFFIALGILDLSTALTSVLGAAGVAGLAVGLALQGTLSNTFSGLMLSFMPKIQIGDWIRTNGYEGFVTDINLRNVVIRTVDQNLVCIPNNKIVENPFKNLSSDNRSIAILTCGVGYESDLDHVEDLTIKAVKEAIPQLKDEKVEFFYTEFGDSSINYEIRFWIEELNAKDEVRAKHLAIKAIRKAYKENEINIPFPIRTLDFGKNKFRAETLEILTKHKE